MVAKSWVKGMVTNLRGPLLLDQIVVFESDDWGAVRTPSNESLSRLKQLGVNVNDCHYTLYDSLASSEDLTALFEVLGSTEDVNGQNPVLTANTIVGNPDFQRIKERDYQEYVWEDFRTSIRRLDDSDDPFKVWKQGIANKLFHPQFHGREHLNISRWIRALQKNDTITKEAFNQGICSLSGHILSNPRGSHLAAYDGSVDEKIFSVDEIVKEGLTKFKQIFGYSSKSMIAPNYVWNDEVEEAGFAKGVRYIQSSTAQRLPSSFGAKTQIKRHYMGQRNILGQMYLLRNCHFEPSSNPHKDWVDSCLNEISIAFKMKKPAIISTHRVNFVGRLNEKNRDRGLNDLSKLLNVIIKKWPDVRFMTSDQLGDFITNRRTHEG